MLQKPLGYIQSRGLIQGERYAEIAGAVVVHSPVRKWHHPRRIRVQSNAPTTRPPPPLRKKKKKRRRGVLDDFGFFTSLISIKIYTCLNKGNFLLKTLWIKENFVLDQRTYPVSETWELPCHKHFTGDRIDGKVRRDALNHEGQDGSLVGVRSRDLAHHRSHGRDLGGLEGERWLRKRGHVVVLVKQVDSQRQLGYAIRFIKYSSNTCAYHYSSYPYYHSI